jgi:hypothetical protein
MKDMTDTTINDERTVTVAEVYYDENHEPQHRTKQKSVEAVCEEVGMLMAGLHLDGHPFVDEPTWLEILEYAEGTLWCILDCMICGSDLYEGPDLQLQHLADIIAQRWLNGTDWRHCGFFICGWLHDDWHEETAGLLDDLVFDIDCLKRIRRLGLRGG